MDLQTPSVLAQLPRPLHASTGKTRIGEVYRLADQKKRKRYEVGVAVDGEAVNIYNIQTPKLVTSYAVPPQSSFTCQPCSVRRKLSNKSSVKRQTYVAVNPQREIKAFVEENSGNDSSAPVISSSAYSVKDSASPAIFVGIIPMAADDEGEEEKDPFDILAVHKDGRVRRLTAGLDAQRWSLHHSELAKLSATQDIHSCFLVDFEEARKSLFKKRQDLAALAQGELTSSGVDQPSVLLLVSHPKGSEKISLGDVQVHMFSVPAHVPSHGLNLDESQKMRHLLTVSIPSVNDQEKLSRDSLQWEFHAGSAGLSLAFDKGFINFDLSQYTPTVTSQFVLENEDFSSVMRISPQSVIGAGKSIVALFDTQYKSIQRSIAVDDLPSTSDSRNDRIIFIGYFAKLGLAVATRGNALVAFDLSSSRTPIGSSLKRSRDGLLIDAIGRGIGASSQWDPSSKKPRTDFASSLGLTAEQTEKWNRLAQALHEATQAKDSAAFDRAVQDYFRTGKSNALPTRKQHVNPEIILFLISFIFSLTDAPSTDKLSSAPSAHLSVAFWPEATCNWLINLGHLSLDNAEIALRRSIKPRILPALPTGSFVQTLVDSDPTFRRLNAVLKGPVPLSSDELAFSLKIFINAARSQPIGPDDANEPTKPVLTNGDAATSNSSVTTATSAQNSPDTALKTIFFGLNTTLHKLQLHPAAPRTASIRGALSRPEIIALIHHLRLSLATGGYTSRFTESPPSPLSPFQTTPPLSLDVIADCLNSAVDAIGPSGWISAVGSTNPFPSEDDDDMSSEADVNPSHELELIADMKAEISAALAGVSEANYFRGILREYLRYADSVQRSLTGGKKKNLTSAETATEDDEKKTAPSTLVRHEKLNGADVMVYGSVGAEDGYDGDASGKMLPLSLKAPSTEVSKTKVKKSTGEVLSRSTREIGYLRRKAVGKYSFERLVV